jgi:outer membrane protein assembly factor BamB
MKFYSNFCKFISFVLLLFPLSADAQDGFQRFFDNRRAEELAAETDQTSSSLYEIQANTLFPEYTVETFDRSDDTEDTIIPLVFNGYLYSFSLSKKIPLWRIFIGGDLLNPFSVHENNVYFYDIFNRIYSIDLNDGHFYWRTYIANEIRGGILIHNNFLIVATLDGAIHVIDRNSGEVIFTYDGEGEINAGLKIFDNLIIVSYKNGKITAYDVKTRSEEWSFSAGGLVSVNPVIKDQFLYFGSWDNTFYALNIFTGEPKWVSYIGETVTRKFIVFEHEIILFFAGGEMVCLTRENGEIKWVKYLKNVEFNYNYFGGIDAVYVFIPDFIAISPTNGNIIFDYRERSFFLYKEMLFDNMVEGENPLSEDEQIRLLSEKYFTVNSYPYLPPVNIDSHYVYFVTDTSYLFVYDLTLDFFILKFRMN